MAKIIEVTSHMPRLHTIGAGFGPAKEVPGKEDRAPGKRHGKVILKPGLNEVSSEDWEQVRELKIIQHYISRGENGGLVEGKTQDGAGGIADLKPGDAVRKIKETLDVGKLREWGETETRQSVSGEIKARIRKIEEQRKPGDESDK